MANRQIVEGRSICKICDTDKGWTFSIDAITAQERRRGVTMTQLVADSVRKQNEIVVEPNHSGHLDKLQRTYRTFNTENWQNSGKYSKPWTDYKNEGEHND